MDVPPSLLAAKVQLPTMEMNAWSLEQQINVLSQQLKQSKQIIAVQQWQLSADAELRSGLECQSRQLQAIAQEVNQVANTSLANMQEALLQKTLECTAKDAEIAALREQLASQQEVYRSSSAAAEQAIATQAKVISYLKTENGILGEAFEAAEKGIKEYQQNPVGRSQTGLILRRQGVLQNFDALPAKIEDVRTRLQQNIQNGL